MQVYFNVVGVVASCSSYLLL